jgi:hypothetical protein
MIYKAVPGCGRATLAPKPSLGVAEVRSESLDLEP